MNLKRTIFIASIVMALTSCDFGGSGNIVCNHLDTDKNHYCDICEIELSKHTNKNDDLYCDYCGAIIKEYDVNYNGNIVDDGNHHGYEFEKEGVTRPTTGQVKVEIFGMNDFHGTVLENEEEKQVGLAKFGTFIKKQTKRPNTLFIDQGDTWQGSFESNHSYGTIVQDVLNEANLTLRTVGNHDFDWGVDRLIQTTNHVYNNRVIPTLAANVYDYDWNNKKAGTTQQSNIGQEYATYVLDNGLKVGIIGVIGDDQITSISTQYAQDIIFTEHTSVIKNISNYLRETKKCDIIVASVHGDQDQVSNTGITSISPVTKKRYVDLVFNGHTHQTESYSENGVIFSQWGQYSEHVGSVTLTYDFDLGKVLDSNKDTDRTSYNYKYINTYYTNNDPTIQNMVDTYLDSIKDMGSQVLSTNFSGTFLSTDNLPKLMTEAMYKEAHKQGFNVDYACANQARESIYSTTVTYSDLYRAFPFDNEIFILEVTGYTSTNSISKYNPYHENTSLRLQSSKTYTIACIDYVALHTNTNRNYDRFPNAKVIGKLKINNQGLTYRELLKNYLLENQTKTFESEYYSTSNWRFTTN